MLVKFDIDNETFQKIKHLIEKKRYPDLNEFLNIAINNQVNEEFANPVFSEQTPNPNLETETDHKERDAVLANVKAVDQLIGQDWRKKLEKIELEESDIEPEYTDLIWSFYNRFFPIKIIIHRLASQVAVLEHGLELKFLQTISYDLATQISEDLKKYESDQESPRNQRFSTGLPTPESELKNINKIRERRKISDKIDSSRQRFMEQFVGKVIYVKETKTKKFKGACFDLGLISIHFMGNNVLLNLTQAGKEFALLENPIIDQGRKDIAFSEKEVEFILKKIIPKFKLEDTMIKRIISNLRENKLSSDEINDIFKEEKMRFLKDKGDTTSKIELETEKKVIVRERVATMSRLSELGLVKWDIDSSGYSTYSLKS